MSNSVTVSMNGLRRNLSRDVETLRDLVSAVIEGNYFEREDLTNAMNDVIQDSNVLNCVFSNDDAQFTDMSDLEVKHIETEE